MKSYYSAGGWTLESRHGEEGGWEIYESHIGYSEGRSKSAWGAIRHSHAPLEVKIALICEVMADREDANDD